MDEVGDSEANADLYIYIYIYISREREREALPCNGKMSHHFPYFRKDILSDGF